MAGANAAVALRLLAEFAGRRDTRPQRPAAIERRPGAGSALDRADPPKGSFDLGGSEPAEEPGRPRDRAGLRLNSSVQTAVGRDLRDLAAITSTCSDRVDNRVVTELKKITAELNTMVTDRGSTLLEVHGVGPGPDPG